MKNININDSKLQFFVGLYLLQPRSILKEWDLPHRPSVCHDFEYLSHWHQQLTFTIEKFV
jgi:hypothetical protein